MPLSPRPPKVVARKCQKKVRYQTLGQKSQVTILACGSATGQIIPPFMIFAVKQISPLWTPDKVSGSRFAVSNSGWVDQELFNFWLTDHFLPNVPLRRPVPSSCLMVIVPTLNHTRFSLQENIKL